MAPIIGCGMRLAMYKPKLSQVPFADGGSRLYKPDKVKKGGGGGLAMNKPDEFGHFSMLGC